MERTITLTEEQGRFLFDLLNESHDIININLQEQAYELAVILANKIWGGEQ